MDQMVKTGIPKEYPDNSIETFKDKLNEIRFFMGELQALTMIRKQQTTKVEWLYKEIRLTYNAAIEIAAFFFINIDVIHSKKIKTLEKEFPLEVMYLRIIAKNRQK